MKNTRRRKRRANPSRNRKQGGKRAVQALAAGAMIAAGTQAYADPVRFDNLPAGEPGRFDWTVSNQPEQSQLRWLDVMLGVADQPFGPYSQQDAPPAAFGQHEDNGFVFASMGGPAQNSGIQVDSAWEWFLVGVNSGELIPSGFPWATYGGTYYPGYGSELPEDQATYLGVRFDLGSGFQYGWVGVVMDPTDHLLDAFAWGYETVPGEPIEAGAIPEPGTLAALALGATALLGRRRCRSQIDRVERRASGRVT